MSLLPVSSLRICLCTFAARQIVLQLLDVDKVPGKPGYPYAPEFPLLLFDCKFEGLPFYRSKRACSPSLCVLTPPFALRCAHSASNCGCCSVCGSQRCRAGEHVESPRGFGCAHRGLHREANRRCDGEWWQRRRRRRRGPTRVCGDEEVLSLAASATGRSARGVSLVRQCRR
jgi:hypothetical protein